MKFSIRLLYLYLFSFVGLLIVVIGSVQLVNLGMRTFVFPDSDNYYDMTPAASPEGKPAFEIDSRTQVTRQRQRDLTSAVSMIVVGLPLYLYHWRTIQKQKATD
jgi:hypothetical protein